MKLSFRRMIPTGIGELIRWARYRRSAAVLHARSKHVDDLGVLFDNVAKSRFAAIQIKSEITALCAELRGRSISRVCEIGASSGGSLFLIARCVATDAVFVSIDIAYPFSKAASFHKLLAAGSQKITCMQADSHRAEAVDRTRSLLHNRPLDFLFIDGDHSYEGVRADFELFAPLVKPGGLIAFHDIVTDNLQRFGRKGNADSGGVPRFWGEIRARYPRETREIVESPEQDGFGIGLLEWPGTAVKGRS